MPSQHSNHSYRTNKTTPQKNGYAHCELTDSSAFTPFSAAFTLVTLTRLSFKLYAALFSAPSEL